MYFLCVRWLPYVDTLLTLLGHNQNVSACRHSASPLYESFLFSFGLLHPTWCLSTRTPSLPNLNSSSPALGTLPYSCPPRLAWLPIPHSKSPLLLDCPPHPAQVLTLHYRLPFSPGTGSNIRLPLSVNRPPSYSSWTLISHSGLADPQRCPPGFISGLNISSFFDGFSYQVISEDRKIRQQVGCWSDLVPTTQRADQTW